MDHVKIDLGVEEADVLLGLIEGVLWLGTSKLTPEESSRARALARAGARIRQAVRRRDEVHESGLLRGGSGRWF